jgi:ketol-acid reductoisomerase
VKSILRNKPLAILGYGSQGRAQALNLRDSGIKPVIGLPTRSRSRKIARRDKFAVTSPQNAIRNAQIISVLLPDHLDKSFFDQLPKSLPSGKSFVFAHGLSIAFGLAKFPRSSDVILVAPHGPGERIRGLYLAKKPFTAFWAVENDASGKASQIARAYAAAIGCPPHGLFKTTFHDEAVGDIFGEQAVLCGGLVGLLETGFETLVSNGFSHRDAYLECIYQLDLIVDLLKKHGPAGMFARISKTAAFGSLRNQDRLFDGEMRRKMNALFEEIENGLFARALMRESASGMKTLKSDISREGRSKLQKAHDRLRKKLAGF